MLFVAPRKNESRLRDVASGVFSALAVSEWEDRHSSNYPPDEHYFAGYCANAQVTVYDADDGMTSEYPFRVEVADASWRKGPGVIATDAASIARTLASGGFTVLVPAGDWARGDWDGAGEVYSA